MISFERFHYISIRLLKGFACILALIAVFLLLGFIVSLCTYHPWANLIWGIPLVTALAWGLGSQ